METTILHSDGELHFHAGQRAAWDSRARFTFMIAGSQSGKTSFGPWWLWREICERGRGDYLAVTASYDLFKLKMLPEMRHVFERACKWGRYWSGDKIIELCDTDGNFWANRADDPMWGRIILRSANAEGGLESTTAKAAWLDECGQDDFALDAWQAVLRRLALNQGRVLGTTTPYNLGWLKTEVYDRWTANDADYNVVQFASTANPLFPPAEFERAKRTMQDWLFQMFYEGKLVRPGHLIYGCFTDVMVVDPFEIPPEWRRKVGVDFGGANQALLWMAEDPETGRWYVYDESIEGGMSTREHADKAKKKWPAQSTCCLSAAQRRKASSGATGQPKALRYKSRRCRQSKSGSATWSSLSSRTSCACFARVGGYWTNWAATSAKLTRPAMCWTKLKTSANTTNWTVCAMRRQAAAV